MNPDRYGPALKAAALSMSNILRLASVLVVTILLGRTSGPSDVGIFSLLLAIVAVLQSLSIGGLAGAAVHKLVSDPRLADASLQVIVAARLILIPLFFISGFICTLLFMSGIDMNISLLALFFLGYAFGTFDVPEIVAMSRGKFHSMAIIRMLVVSFVALPKFVFAAWGNLEWVLLWQGVEAALWQLGLVRIASVRFSAIGSGASNLKSGWKQILELRNLWLSSIASSLAQRGDLFIVGVMLGSATLGQYSTTSRPVEAVIIIAVAVMTVLFNGLVVASSHARDYAARSVRSARTIFLIAVVVTLGLAAVGPFIIRLLYGPDFQPAANLLPLYALSVLPLFQRQLLSKILIIEKAYAYSLASNLSTLIMNFVLNLIFIPMLGMAGAALSAVLAHILSMLFVFLPTRYGRDLLVLSVGATIMRNSRVMESAQRLIQERESIR